ncbi:CinA family protein [Roseomonas sp. CCTCC AB2023176]|uniref:CinA family protein n=1 Tax=Roseomonas sp. CCTCC AB2023176 TaxID=3342640 RepID=UPI0035D5556E
MLDGATLLRAAEVIDRFRAAGLTIATAESCTGGLIAAALTAIPGSSDVVLGGFVTYSNEAKAAMVGVDPGVIARVGAVSEEVARAMAEGARRATGASVAVSATGIAGPGGATLGKPVGLVFIGAAAAGGRVEVRRRVFPGDRAAVRAATVGVALETAAAMA